MTQSDIKARFRKKLISVWTKIGISITVAGLLATTLYVAYLLGQTMYEPTIRGFSTFYTYSVNVLQSVQAFVTITIPYPWNAAIAGVITLIVGSAVYSWAWCVSREFTDEDKKGNATFMGCLIIALCTVIPTGISLQIIGHNFYCILAFPAGIGGFIIGLLIADFVDVFVKYNIRIKQQRSE